MGPGLVALEPFLHQVVNHLLVLAALHVDEIADDQATDITQSKLTRDFICRLQVRLQNCFLDIAPTFVAARIHINGDERFGLIDHNIAAALQPDLPMKSVIDLLLHAISFENRRRTVVKADSISCAPGNLAETFPLSRIFDLARNATSITEWHEDQIPSRKTEISRDSRSFCPNRTFGDLHDYLRADRVNVWNILCRDSFARPLVCRAVNFLDSTVKCGRNRIPEMKEGVFFEADVDKHRLQPHLDVSNFTLVNAADDVPRVLALDAVFFESTILEQGDPGLEFFHAEYEFVAGR